MNRGISDYKGRQQCENNGKFLFTGLHIFRVGAQCREPFINVSFEEVYRFCSSRRGSAVTEATLQVVNLSKTEKKILVLVNGTFFLRREDQRTKFSE